MKCVRTITGEQPEVKRVPDQQAEQLVASGKYAYCSRKLWKQFKKADAPKPEQPLQAKGDHQKQKSHSEASLKGKAKKKSLGLRKQNK